jgi:signal transduction histidine kinase
MAATAAGPGWWRARDVMVRDAVFAAGVVALTLVPGTGQLGAAIGDLPVRRLDGWGVVLVGLLSVPLALRRRYPGWCLALVGGGFAGYELVGYAPTFATLDGYAALYAAGAYLERGRARVAAGATAGYLLLAIGLHGRGSPQRPADYLLFFLVLAACWAVGAWARTRRRAEAARERESVAAATSRERARIARELHDIVTHHVTAMVVQADAAGYLVSEAPERVTAGLTAISETGRRALADLRDLLAVLRASEPVAGGARSARSPALSELAELVERTRAAGQPVELIEEGTPRRSSDGVELAAYRVAQESLTNALKHAPGRRTVVRVGHLPDEVRIEVTTAAGPDGAGRRPAGTHGHGLNGHGLMGLAERISLYGGELRAGPAPDGAFGVRAAIPRSGEV